MIWKDPSCDLPKIVAVLRHLYLDELSGIETGRISGCGTVTPATSATLDARSIIYRSSEKAGRHRSGYDVTANDHGKKYHPAGQKESNHEAVLCRSDDAQCLGQPRTTPGATRKDFHAYRWAVDTRQL